MNVLPRILYLLQAIPIRIPNTFFRNYKQICLEFIWNGKHARIKWDKLIVPKLMGGIGLPDIEKYYWACHLTRIVARHLHGRIKDCVVLEEYSYTQSVPLKYLPWIEPRKIPKAINSHPITGTSLKIFRFLCKKHNISSIYGPLTPLTCNPGIPLVHSANNPDVLPIIEEHRAGNCLTVTLLFNLRLFLGNTLTVRFPLRTLTWLPNLLIVRIHVQSGTELKCCLRFFALRLLPRGIWSPWYMLCSIPISIWRQTLLIWSGKNNLTSLSRLTNGKSFSTDYTRAPWMFWRRKMGISFTRDGIKHPKLSANSTQVFQLYAGAAILHLEL